MKNLTKKQIFDLQVKYSNIQPKKGGNVLFENWWESVYGWLNVAMNEDLSEEFLREFKDHIPWITVMAYQKKSLSEKFINEMEKEGYIKIKF